MVRMGKRKSLTHSGVPRQVSSAPKLFLIRQALFHKCFPGNICRTDWNPMSRFEGQTSLEHVPHSCILGPLCSSSSLENLAVSNHHPFSSTLTNAGSVQSRISLQSVRSAPCQDWMGWVISWWCLNPAPRKSQPDPPTHCLCVRRQETPGPNRMVVMAAKSKIDTQTQALFGWLWPTCKHKYCSCWKEGDLLFYSRRCFEMQAAHLLHGAVSKFERRPLYRVDDSHLYFL